MHINVRVDENAAKSKNLLICNDVTQHAIIRITDALLLH